MRQWSWVSAMVLGILLLPVATAWGGFVATVNNAGSSGNSVSINPSGSALDRTFSVDINVSVSPESITSVEMNLFADTSGVAEVTGGAYGPDWDAMFAEPIPVGAVPVLADILLDPFAGLLGIQPTISPLTGGSLLATLDIEVPLGTAEGVYHLNLTEFFVGNHEFNDIGGTAGADFVLTVVPEPMSLLALLLGLPLVCRRVRSH